jgi:hypothetical protein
MSAISFSVSLQNKGIQLKGTISLPSMPKIAQLWFPTPKNTL